MDFLKRFLDGRMIFERIETRIIVGITAFVATMILITWVAINENARMAAFERQFLARSIERGAALYVNNCATCHGIDGRGLAGRAPGLNNPQLFGFDPYVAVLGDVAVTFRDLRDQSYALMNERTDLEAERDALIAERDSTENPVNDERRAEIETRLTEIEARLTEIDAGIAELEPQIAELQTRMAEVDALLGTATVAGYSGDYDPHPDGSLRDTSGYDRLRNVGWGSTLPSFIRTTLISGRPVSENYWPDPMPAWSQTAGGPLRQDQIDDLVNYIMNFNRDWTVDDLLTVQQFAIEPGLGNGSSVETVGSDSEAGYEAIQGLTADPQRGQQLYTSTMLPEAQPLALGCSGCHVGAGVQGPQLEGTWTRVQTERPLERYNNDGVLYLVTSILHPADYVVDGFNNVMPANFGERLTAQELADIVAFLQSQDQ